MRDRTMGLGSDPALLRDELSAIVESSEDATRGFGATLIGRDHHLRIWRPHLRDNLVPIPDITVAAMPEVAPDRSINVANLHWRPPVIGKPFSRQQIKELVRRLAPRAPHAMS